MSSELVRCNCGSVVKRSGYSAHSRSNKHVAFMSRYGGGGQGQMGGSYGGYGMEEDYGGGYSQPARRPRTAAPKRKKAAPARRVPQPQYEEFEDDEEGSFDQGGFGQDAYGGFGQGAQASYDQEEGDDGEEYDE